MPEFAAPYVEPYLEPFLEDMREAFRGFNRGDGKGGQPKDKDCEDFRDQLQKVKNDNFDRDPQDPNKWVIDVINIGNLKDLELFYEWEGGEKTRADCEDKGAFLRCSIPNIPAIQTMIKFWIALDDCEDELGLIKWDKDGNQIERVFQLTDPSDDCCPDLEVTYTGYIQPTVLRLLEIDLACENGAWNIDDGECIDGEVFVGADQDIFWTDVECCLSDDELHCESPGTVDQKKSKTKLELSGDTCSQEVFFQSPYYAPSEAGEDESPCPPGQVLCAGSCCAGVCSDGYCYED